MSSGNTVSIARPRPVSQLNRKVFLGLYDSRSWPEPDSRDEQRVRDYMVQKYENKRWYVAPTEAMKEEAKRTNEAALNSKPQVKPLRSLLGENASKLTVGAAPTPPASHAPVTVSVPLPSGFKSPPATNNIHTSGQPPAKPSGFDLLGELGGDPFASNSQAKNNHSDGGFADFSNFDSFSASVAQPPSAAVPSQQHIAQQAFPISSTPLQPLGIGQPPAQPATTNTRPSTVSTGDRYAALADLDSAFSAPATTATSINWGGTEGGAINWGGTSSTASTPSHSTSGLSWSTTGASAGGPINWNSQGTTPTSAGFGISSTAANPFGGSGGAGISAFSSTAPVSTVNPFGAAAPTSMTHFSQAGGMVSMPVSTSAGFGAHFAAPGQPAGFGQFPPIQNGGYGMTPTTAGYGGAQGFMMPSQAGVVQNSGWGSMGGMPQGGPVQPVANPFMNTAMHQQVPPPSGSTNPFL